MHSPIFGLISPFVQQARPNRFSHSSSPDSELYTYHEYGANESENLITTKLHLVDVKMGIFRLCATEN